MIEIIFQSVKFNVQPVEDADGNQGKQINIFHPESGTTYVFPLGQEGAEVLAGDLTLTNQELQDRYDAAVQQDVLDPGSE